jgi:Fic family protein
MNRKLEILIQDVLILSKGNVNYDKLAMYITTFHSTSIEGSTVTENEVINLLSYNKTSKKPMEHHLMVMDHYEALSFCIAASGKKKNISLKFIQELAALVKKNTGSKVSTVLGDYDISKGDLRLSGVFAGRRQFPDAKKVPVLLDKLALEVNSGFKNCVTTEDKIKLAFRAHFQLVSIHPFHDCIMLLHFASLH